MLNSTKVIRYIEKMLGYKFNELEIDTEEILENIREETLREFSKKFPYPVLIRVTSANELPNRRGSYYLNVDDLDIVNVAKVINNSAAMIDPSFSNLRYGVQLNQFDLQLIANISSMCYNPLTFQFESPNIVTIYPYSNYYGDLSVVVNCVHPEHFGTIPTNLEKEFLKLALLDTKIILYPLRHRFANLNTPYGNIELFIDDLQGAEDEKKELLENWRKSITKTSSRKKIFIF